MDAIPFSNSQKATEDIALQDILQPFHLRGLLRPFCHGGPLKQLSNLLASLCANINKPQRATPLVHPVVNSDPIVSTPVDSVASPTQVVKSTKTTIQESRIIIESQSYTLTHTKEEGDFHLVASSTFDQTYEQHLHIESWDTICLPEPSVQKSEKQLAKEKLACSWAEAHTAGAVAKQTAPEIPEKDQETNARSERPNSCLSSTSSVSKVWSEPSVASTDNTDLGDNEGAGLDSSTNPNAQSTVTGEKPSGAAATETTVYDTASADAGDDAEAENYDAGTYASAEEHLNPSHDEDPSTEHARPGPPGSLVLYGLGSDGLVYWYRPDDDLCKSVNEAQRAAFETAYPGRVESYAVDETAEYIDDIAEYANRSDSSSSSFVSDPDDDEDERTEGEDSGEYNEYQHDNEKEYEYNPGAEYKNEDEDQVLPTGIMATRWSAHSFIDEDGFVNTWNNPNIRWGLRLSQCKWVPFQSEDEVEPSSGPELKLTTPDGGECWLDDITRYVYEYVPSEDEAGSR
ncbi:hypothetical protein B0T24DRAFT_599455 [Lasiosphaeria ovina]|uniref:Uncharacterized protein n=1 Tax=Lasiosphaeria ovina TaxID=92902 RepID=A0AAE0MY07_9PEZI|nr:hypothetical protein B0T24DRAFT_599455 [Lasiosphaeria ovina]